MLKVVGDLAWEISRADGIVDDDVDDFQTKRYGTLVESMRKAQRFVARRAGAVITPSHYLKNLVIGWGVPSERVHVIENGARPKPETRLTREDARARLELDGDPILISAGRLVPWKGYEHIIDSMPAILRDHPRARLLIVGSGPCETALRERVQKLELDDAVQLLGARAPTELAMHLRASDVFVLVSTYEGFSHLLLEAMQSELPVVASRCGGNPELVGDADSGLLVSPDPREAKPPSESFSPIRRCENASAQEANDAWKISRGRRWSRIRHNFFKTPGTTHGSLRCSFRWSRDFRQLLASGAHRFGLSRMLEQPQDALGDSVLVSRRYEKARLLVLDELGDAADIGRNHGKPARHRLPHDTPQPFGQRRQHEQSSTAILFSKIGR